MKFKPGDEIVPAFGIGFEKAKVKGVFTESRGVHKGKKMYLLKIVNGTATMPVSSEVNYKLKTDE